MSDTVNRKHYNFYELENISLSLYMTSNLLIHHMNFGFVMSSITVLMAA